MMGFIFFTGWTLMMMYLQMRANCERYYNPSDSVVLLLVLFFLIWCCYFLTLSIMRLRHAGCVCSGDKLYITNDQSGPPYMIGEGSFLYWVWLSHFLFPLVMGAGGASLVN